MGKHTVLFIGSGVFLCLVAVTIIGHSFLSTPKNTFATPKECLKTAEDAINQNNDSLFRSCFAKDHNSKMLAAMFSFSVSATAFKREFIKCYGNEAWENFQDSEGASLSIPSFDDVSEKLIIREHNAYLPLDDGNKKLVLIKDHNSWYLDNSFFYDEDTNPNLSRTMLQCAKAIDKIKAKIGKEVDPETLDRDLGKDFVSIMLGTTIIDTK